MPLTDPHTSAAPSSPATGSGGQSPPPPNAIEGGGRDAFAHIEGFLRAVRRRALLCDALAAAGYSAAAFVLALLGMSIVAASVGPADFWRPLTAIMGALAAAATIILGLVRAALRLTSRAAVARHVARLHPPLSDRLLSAVELAPLADPRVAASVSPGLVQALGRQVANELEPLSPEQLIPRRRIVVAALVFAICGGVLAVTAALGRDVVGRGLRLLVHRPSRFEGAAVAAGPIVADTRVVYRYPDYTGLPPRTVEGSTGDIVAVKGTRVRIEARALRSVRHAALLLGENGEHGELPVHVQDRHLVAELRVDDNEVYRFWLDPTLGRPVRDGRSHRIEAEADRAPRIELFSPGEHLELPTPRPLELGYSADDDFGLDRIELVWRLNDRPEERRLLRDAAGARTAEGRLLWDPATLALAGGDRVSYRMEAIDRDDISGRVVPGGKRGNVGVSRTMYLVVQKPRASIEDRLQRERELLDRLLGSLADRLERAAAGTTHEDAAVRLHAWNAVHETEESHVALLGQLLDADRREPSMRKPLRTALAGIGERLGRLLRDESARIAAARSRPGAAPAAVRWIDANTARHVAELESDVLLLDDLIGRERLQDLAAAARELADMHRRLKDLLDRYQATHDEALRRQLARELRDLRARIDELAQKIAALKTRNEVPEEWRNMPDMKSVGDQARKLQDLLERGDPTALSQALSQLGGDLQGLQKLLERNVNEFGDERFPQESRAMAALMRRLGDLEGDERELERATQPIADRQDAERRRQTGASLQEFLKREAEKVDRLKQRLGRVRTGDADSPFGQELERARESARRLQGLLGQRELYDARAESEQAATSSDRAAMYLRDRETGKRRGGADEEGVASLQQARDLAREISSDLDGMLPKAEKTLSPDDRQAARGHGERQTAIGERTEEVAREAAGHAGKVPGVEGVEPELRSIAERMRAAAERLREGEARQALHAERDAAERLQRLRDSLQDRQLGAGQQQRDPVRIPGADDSRAPREWRQELLDAMKERGPERFRDETRRYYEELVR